MDAPIKNKEIVGKEMGCIRDTLENTEHSGLSVEVVWSAIRYAKENPEADICEIMDAAIDEWDLGILQQSKDCDAECKKTCKRQCEEE